MAVVKSHERFLRQSAADLSPNARRLPIRFLELIGLECALWPHLYPRVEMCETFVRRQDARRLAREAADAASSSDSTSSSDDDEVRGFAARMKASSKTRQSLKASFLAKVMSPVIGYGCDHQLAQYVWDLWLWTALGGAKNASGVSMRHALRGKTFSPEYWKTYHAALVDLQRQLGFPSLFITLSPFEWSTPYHVWIEDELKKAFSSRQYLAGAETFHMTHALTQIITGMLTGVNKNRKRQDRRWLQHVLRPKEPPSRGIFCF